MKSILLLFALSLHADTWDRVKTLRPGRQVRIETHDGRRIHGAFTGMDGDRVIIRKGRNDTAYSRAAVTRIGARSHTIGVGLGLASAILTANPNFYSPIAASVNALLPAYQTVYRKEKR